MDDELRSKDQVVAQSDVAEVARTSSIRDSLDKLKDLPPRQVEVGAVATQKDGQLDAGVAASASVPIGRSKWTFAAAAQLMKDAGASAALLFRRKG